MKIASIQLNSEWQDLLGNMERAATFIKKAYVDGCDLVVLPEMFASGFSMNAQKVAQVPDGPINQGLCQLAKKYRINIIAGLVEVIDGVFQNVAVMIDRNGQQIVKYIKNYPFTHAGEHRYYRTGDETVVYDIDGIKASTFICYDLRFPELFRKVAQQVSLMVVIASWPKVRADHWLSLLKARAIENQCFVVGVNRIGTDGNNLDYAGGSQVIDPYGQILSHAEYNKEYQLTTLDINIVEQIREKLPFLQDIKKL